MNLNKKVLRRMILKEIKLLSESVIPTAIDNNLSVGGKLFKLSKGPMPLKLVLLKMNPNGSANVIIKAGFIKKTGTVSKEQVNDIVVNALQGNEFTIQAGENILTATPI